MGFCALEHEKRCFFRKPVIRNDVRACLGAEQSDPGFIYAALLRKTALRSGSGTVSAVREWIQPGVS